MEGNKAINVLAVDDEPYISDIVYRWLTGEGYQCDTAADAESAASAIDKGMYDLVLLDMNLPGVSGIALLAEVKERHPDLAVLMVTGVDDRTTARECLKLGAYAYVVKPLDQRDVLNHVAGALENRRRTLAAHREQDALEEKVRDRNERIRSREEEIALRLVAAAEYRDEELPAHIRRIGMFSEILARALGWDPLDVDDIRIAASMHDIGKIGVPDGILLKPGKLMLEEYEVVKLHARIGARLLGGSDIPLLKMVADIALSHHERWDGSGYPDGATTHSIPEASRIVAIADVWDSLTHTRLYRPAFSEKEALDMMGDDRDKHFDPVIFDAFVDALPAFRRVTRQVADETAQVVGPSDGNGVPVSSCAP